MIATYFHTAKTIGDQVNFVVHHQLHFGEELIVYFPYFANDCQTLLVLKLQEIKSTSRFTTELHFGGEVIVY